MGKYLLGFILYYLIILAVCIPSIIYITLQYGTEFFEILYNSFLDPYFQELVASYFNVNELFIILILLSIPAIYIAIRLSFWSYLIIDQDLNGFKAIQTSWSLTQRKSIEIILISFLLLIFNVLGIFSIIGICITAPVSYLFYCLFFRHLLAQQQ